MEVSFAFALSNEVVVNSIIQGIKEEYNKGLEDAIIHYLTTGQIWLGG